MLVYICWLPDIQTMANMLERNASQQVDKKPDTWNRAVGGGPTVQSCMLAWSGEFICFHLVVFWSALGTCTVFGWSFYGLYKIGSKSVAALRRSEVSAV